MRDKMQHFMDGRYGRDSLNVFLLVATFILLVVGLFTRIGLLDFLALILLVWSYFRMFSRNTYARSMENTKFMDITGKITRGPARWKRMFSQRKVYRFYTCPNCRQKIRVPRGKGKIEITCPKCRTRFIKKS